MIEILGKAGGYVFIIVLGIVLRKIGFLRRAILIFWRKFACASAAPVYTRELDENVGLASAINSLSVICSIVIIVGILTFMT